MYNQETRKNLPQIILFSFSALCLLSEFHLVFLVYITVKARGMYGCMVSLFPLFTGSRLRSF